MAKKKWRTYDGCENKKGENFKMDYVWIIESCYRDEPIIFKTADRAYYYLYHYIEDIAESQSFSPEPYQDFLKSSYRQNELFFGFNCGQNSRWARRVEVQE